MITIPIHAPLSVQRARAQTISSVLSKHGFAPRTESRKDHPGAFAVARYSRGAVNLLVLSLGYRHGQIVEIEGGARARSYPTRGGHSIGGRPSWRLTAYDPPAEAVVDAALAAREPSTELGAFEVAGWRTARPHIRSVKRPRFTTYTRPDGAVVASFHVPTFTPTCDYCSAVHGDHGDAGGWLIKGVGVACDATAHTPGSVVSAFALGLPSGRLFPGWVMPTGAPAAPESGEAP